MFSAKTRWRSTLVAALLASATTLAADEDRPGRPSLDLTAEIDGPLLADFPLLFKLTVTNSGKTPIWYGCEGPGEYPTAAPLVAAATDEQGRTRKLRLNNGQYDSGISVRTYPIETTQMLPAACDPLPAGKYTIQISAEAADYRPAMTSKPIAITIIADREALALANEQLRRREKSDPFAHYLAEAYGIDPNVQEWLNQLLDDDPKVGLEATGHLRRVLRLPSGGDSFYKKAAVKFCHPPTVHGASQLLQEICVICRGLETDDAIDAMEVIAKSTPTDLEQTRRMAISSLGEVPGERAENVLIDLSGNKNTPVYEVVSSSLKRHRRPVSSSEVPVKGWDW